MVRNGLGFRVSILGFQISGIYEEPTKAVEKCQTVEKVFVPAWRLRKG
jgi:hypothetical protein